MSCCLEIVSTPQHRASSSKRKVWALGSDSFLKSPMGHSILFWLLGSDACFFVLSKDLVLGGSALHPHTLIPLEAILIFLPWRACLRKSWGKFNTFPSPPAHQISSLPAWRVEPRVIGKTVFLPFLSTLPYIHKTKSKCKLLPVLTDTKGLTLESLWFRL